MSWLVVAYETVVGSGGVCALAVVENGEVEVAAVVVVVVEDGDVFTAGVDAVVCVEVFLVRTGAVVFHWWVEKGLVTLAGSVTSWSPTVDKSDSGTVGRSQAGRLLIDSSAWGQKKHVAIRNITRCNLCAVTIIHTSHNVCLSDNA